MGRSELQGPALRKDRGPYLTEFEKQVHHLGLPRSEYAASAELKLWCERNRNRVYVPEWLLKEWGMTVDTLGDVA